MRVDARPSDYWFGGIGVAGLVGAFVMIALWPRPALTGWLGAAVLVQAIPTGALMLLMMMRLIGGAWESDLRGACEAAAMLLPLAALAFLPVLAGMGIIYDWPTATAASAFQDAYLDYIPFALRTVLWFIALAIAAWSQVGKRASEGASAFGLIVLVLLATFVADDWLMSLDVQFASSGFGLQLISIEICIAYLVVLLLRLVLQGAPERLSILGGVLLTLLLLWAYFQFMSFFITWSGNLPDGVSWYLARSHDGWNLALWAFSVLGGFVLLALLFPTPRSKGRWLIILSVLALLGKAIEVAWFALPGRGETAVLAFVVALVGLGALTIAGLMIAFRRVQQRKQPT